MPSAATSTQPEGEYFLPLCPAEGSAKTVLHLRKGLPMTGDRDNAMLGVNTVLHLQEGTAMIGTDTLVLPPLCKYIQAVQLILQVHKKTPSYAPRWCCK
jgi:hypothetical protein